MPTCARHPDVATGLSCSDCGTPICPRCAVPAPVGHKCPDCARAPRPAVGAGRYARGVAAGAAAAVGAAAAMFLLVAAVGWLTWIGALLCGMGVGRAVEVGSRRAPVPALRGIAVGAAVVGVAAGWVLAAGSGVLAHPSALISVLSGGYGAWLAAR